MNWWTFWTLNDCRKRITWSTESDGMEEQFPRDDSLLQWNTVDAGHFGLRKQAEASRNCRMVQGDDCSPEPLSEQAGKLLCVVETSFLQPLSLSVPCIFPVQGSLERRFYSLPVQRLQLLIHLYRQEAFYSSIYFYMINFMLYEA